MEKKNINLFFFVTLFTDSISASSNLPENLYMLSLKTWMVYSCIHAELSVLEVVKDTACLTEAEYKIVGSAAVYMSFSTFSQSVPIYSL